MPGERKSAGDESLRVECYAGHRGEQTPRRFFLGGRVVKVYRVIDQWLAPDHRYFKVEGPRGQNYILRHDCASDRWELVMYQRRGPSPPVARHPTAGQSKAAPS